jgi:hypothetical protein
MTKTPPTPCRWEDDCPANGETPRKEVPAADDLRTESLRTRFPAELLHRYRFADREAVHGVVFLDGEPRVAAVQKNCRVSIVNLRTGRIEQTWYPEDRSSRGGLAVSPDGKRLAVACNIRVFLLDTEQLHVQWKVADPGRQASFSHVVFSDDGSRLLADGRQVGMVCTNAYRIRYFASVWHPQYILAQTGCRRC